MPSQLTILLKSLPEKISRRDIETFFVNRVAAAKGQETIIDNVGHIYKPANSQTRRAVVTFTSYEATKRALKLTRSQITAETASPEDPAGRSLIDVDAEFLGLTTLYEPPLGKETNLDIVLVHGLTGHAWRTFSKEEKSANFSTERSWLRDELPGQLQHREVFARVMTYGYNANMWRDSAVGDITEPLATLVQLLGSEREQCPTRPLIFIAHSLGGIISKQTIVEMNKTTPVTFVGGCTFFGVPHGGSRAADWARILTVFSSLGVLETGKIKNLELKSTILNRIADEFAQVRNAYRIPVRSCYETKKTMMRLIVPKESAVFLYEGVQPPLPIDRNHSDMIKFRTDAIADAIMRMAVDVVKVRVINPNNVVQRSPIQTEDQVLRSSTSMSRPRESVELQTSDTGFAPPGSPENTGLPVSPLLPPIPQRTQSPMPQVPQNADSDSINSMEASVGSLENPERGAQFKAFNRSGPIIQNSGNIQNLQFDLRGVTQMDETIYAQLDAKGRDKELAAMDRYFLTMSASLRKVLVLNGLGGIGKSQLAAQYAEKHREHYTAIFWIDGSTLDNYRRQVAHVAYLVVPGAQPTDESEKLLEHVILWLEKPGNSKWLLIVDNVDRDAGGHGGSSSHYNLDQALPGAHHGSIIITTRDASLTRQFKSIDILPLQDKKASARLLAEISGRNPDDLGPIVDCLGGLPLALEQAGSLLKETSLTVDEYVEAWTNEWEKLVDMMAMNDLTRSIRITWAVSFSYIQNMAPDGQNATKLLQLSSFLDHNKIAQSLFTQPKTTPWPEFRSTNYLRGTGTSKFSMVEKHQDPRTFSVHPVVHEWSFYSGADNHKELFQIAALIVAAGAVWNGTNGTTSIWHQEEQLVLHVKRLSQLFYNKGEEMGVITHDLKHPGARRVVKDPDTISALRLFEVVMRDHRYDPRIYRDFVDDWARNF
ncbi:hypothetical protein VTL71DRAFT_15149 [Oculimacula yallundae]|uniref:NB-ARC domain-containing protein n=1 Tax=Oculimacula yallundae TaxID=86028 RepID=A0ABR4CH19_9HELO